MSKIKGITYAAVSSSTFGLAPCFTLLLLGNGYTPFEVLSYRWGIASLCMILWGLLFRYNFRLKRKEWGAVLGLSVFRAVTSLSLVFAYQNIASGVASTIHFMYPLAVALAMTLFSGKENPELFLLQLGCQLWEPFCFLWEILTSAREM